MHSTSSSDEQSDGLSLSYLSVDSTGEVLALVFESNRDVPSVSVIEVLPVSTFSAVPLGTNDRIMDHLNAYMYRNGDENGACENMKDRMIKSSQVT
jgi:hypothetical protein